MLDSDYDNGEFEMSWRPTDIVDVAEDVRDNALNEVCMAAIRIVLPDPAQVQLYQDLMVKVPGLEMRITPMPGTEGVELVNVSWGKYLIVRAVVVSKWGMTGRIPYATTTVVQMRTILTNFV